MTKTIYLASRFSRKDELNGYRRSLERDGCEVTSRWLTGAHEWIGTVDEFIPHSAQQQFANDDLEDIERADILIAFTEPSGSGPARGGRHVELGYALALGKHVIVVGWRENVFCHLPEIIFCETFDAAHAYIVDLRVLSSGKVAA